MVTCRICKGDHWTTKCPYKDTLGATTIKELEESGKHSTTKSTASDENSYFSTSENIYVFLCRYFVDFSKTKAPGHCCGSRCVWCSWKTGGRSHGRKVCPPESTWWAGRKAGGRYGIEIQYKRSGFVQRHSCTIDKKDKDFFVNILILRVKLSNASPSIKVSTR